MQNDWKELFGEEEEEENIITIPEIPGLKLIRQALSHEQQMTIVHEIIKDGYFAGAENINQAMCFGRLPPYISWIETFIKQNYPSEGIVSHVDLLRFDDGILIISLLSSCVMTMKPANKTSLSYKKSNNDENSIRHDILLRPGDILALSEDSRYKWEHGIEERLFDEIDGDFIERGTRISVTLRKLREGEVNDQDMVITASR
ncbi:hypothetical protein G6F57_000384 [Rhizopus arrhizus]|uniref:Alpha-ketoglutarate-dependent dioxygenase AlkB-like domain-containing protein n=1 Tax=Rhizopus oryzae TaxID=64495 RepID=A0A9P6XK17_RHIOR|nr:hypothetical protein G6F23_000453 [Rhizopus arrhizus]KAG1421181.1 hypothetical protein G6F58_003856 [Rhizopus delemar]KAG0769778.1 hypothetical protein G6F24_000793 [Rhizopus arrhizus]KAG0784202.1 hypothetical protein G6F22_008399 [Rhizopus arrhizus]KAG0795557.1 hypothetical protein G6F21_002019 [Rhizopus arrhizus]